MNAAQRIELIAGAKQIAVPVASCVAGGVRPDHLLGGKSRDELLALVVVLAEAVDHGKLNVLVRLPGDEGLTPESLREAMLRRAHTEVWRLREAGQEIPPDLHVLEDEYQALHPRSPRPSRGPGARLEWRRQQGEAA